ncbi:unnamed protein product, partial [Meganyctiphanes norvegica]
MWELWPSRYFILLLLQNVVALTTASSKPNIVFILADDLGWNHVSWHNSSVISPRMQELVDTGINLEQNYVQPVCTPSRSALLTGMYPFHLGRQSGIVKPQEPTGVSLNFTFFPELLQGLGYSTHAIGKWHVGFCDWKYTPLRRGFDTFYGLLFQMAWNYMSIKHQFSRHADFDWRDQERVAKEVKGTYSTVPLPSPTATVSAKQLSLDEPMLYSCHHSLLPHTMPKPSREASVEKETKGIHTAGAMDHSMVSKLIPSQSIRVDGATAFLGPLPARNAPEPSPSGHSSFPIQAHEKSTVDQLTPLTSFYLGPLSELVPYASLLVRWRDRPMKGAGLPRRPSPGGYRGWDRFENRASIKPREVFLSISENQLKLDICISLGLRYTANNGAQIHYNQWMYTKQDN